MKIVIHYETEKGQQSLVLPFKVDGSTRTAQLNITVEAIEDIVRLAQTSGMNVKVTE